MRKMKSNSGFGFVDTLISLTCLLLLVLSTVGYFSRTLKAEAPTRAGSSRDKIHSTIQTLAGMATSIRVSMQRPGNEALANCLQVKVVFDPDEPGDCNADNTYVPFTLYDPVQTASGGAGMSSGEVAGKDSSPVRYDQMGIVCSSGATASECPIEVRTWFKPQCPPKSPSLTPSTVCDVAEVIEVKYEIREPASTNLSGIKFRTIAGSLVTMGEDISYPAANNPVYIDPKTLIPPPADPSPLPAPGSGPVVSSGPPPTPAPPPPPPPTVTCVGDTIQIAPLVCACPPGEVLTNARKGKCSKLSR